MNPRINLKLTQLSAVSLYRKFAIAFLLMSLVPTVLIVYVITNYDLTHILGSELAYFRLTILLVVLLSLAAFDVIRRSMLALGRFSERAKDIAAGKYNERVDITEKDEVGALANSFNKITAELEAKIKDLEASKKLLQNILEKIGTAVTSPKGIDNLLELIIQSLAQGLTATSGAIFIADSSLSGLTMKVSFGMDKMPAGITIKSEDGLIGRVMRFKKPEMVSDVNTNSAAYFEFKHKLARHSIIAVPLLFKNKVLGVIFISDKKDRDSFNNDDLILLSNVAAQTAVAIENFQLNEDAEKTYLETITALAVAVEAKDRYSKGHLERVASYVEKLGRHMGLDSEMMKVLKSGAFLHDVGKIGVRDDILRKEGPLTESEAEEMRDHVIIGVNIIKPIRSMSALCDLVRYHQECYDGSGYPDGLKAEEIPLVARILKVCDAYDAMTTDRPYHKAMSKEDAKKELIKKSNVEFDPKVVEEFLKVI